MLASNSAPLTPAPGPIVSYFRMWKTNMRLTVRDPAVQAVVDRLCHQFASLPTNNAVDFQVHERPDGRWSVFKDGVEMGRRNSPLGAAQR